MFLLKIMVWVVSIPFWLLFGLLFILNDLFYYLFLGWVKLLVKKPVTPVPARQPLKASVIILNWNGKDLMQACLPSVVEAVKYEGGEHEIIVVDNGSTDGSVAFVQENFPEVKILALEKNYYFVGGNNRGAKFAQNEILVFLNNDMAVEKDFLRPLLEGFTDDQVFAVTAQIFMADPSKRRVETGKSRVGWENGLLWFSHALPEETGLEKHEVPAFWMGGGASAVNREKFLAVGGFDTLMDPFYFEDTSTSYQAWKRGWRVKFCPQSKVIHRHRSSTSRLDPAYVDRIYRRNALFVIWRNVTDPGRMAAHFLALLFLPWHPQWTAGFKQTLRIFLDAWFRLPKVLWARTCSHLHQRRSDRQVFQIANSTTGLMEDSGKLPASEPGQPLKILFLCPYFPSLLHGGGIRMYHVIRGLAQRHEVTLLSFWDDPEDIPYFEQMEAVCKKVVAIRRKPYPQASNPLGLLPGNMAVEFGDPAYRKALDGLLDSEVFDVVQCEYILMGQHLPKLKTAALIFTEIELQFAAIDLQYQMEKRPWERLKNRLKWLHWFDVEFQVAKKADWVITLTQEDGDQLKRYEPGLPLSVIQTGVDLDYFMPGEAPPLLNSLVYIGNYRHTPNVDAVLWMANEILPLIHTRVEGAQFYVVGGHVPAEIQALADRPDITVTGWVEDMRPLIAAASIIVLPIRMGMGMRNKTLEAWAMEKAVVSTSLGAYGMEARHKENIWVADTAAEFAEGVVTLLLDEGLRQRMGKQARQFVLEERSWESVARKHEQIYGQVLARKRQALAQQRSGNGSHAG